MRRLEKQQAIRLRLQGKSYNEIKKILNIPSKGTLSYWFKNLSLSQKATKRLEKNVLLARQRGLFKFNHDRAEAIFNENKYIQESGRREIGSLSGRELLLISAALYWGEGRKSERNRNSLGLALANSDPQLIQVYMRFLRKILNIKDEKIRAAIHIYPNIIPEDAKRFWAEITGLPQDRFSITVQISSASKFRRPRNSLPYGTVSIRVNNRPLFYKMKGYIEGISNNGH